MRPFLPGRQITVKNLSAGYFHPRGGGHMARVRGARGRELSARGKFKVFGRRRMGSPNPAAASRSGLTWEIADCKMGVMARTAAEGF